MWFEKIFQVFFYLLFVDLSNQLMNFVRLLIYFCIRSLFLLQLSIATIWEICLDALFQRNLLKFIRTNKWRNSAIFTPISIKQLKKYFYKPTFFIYLSLYIYIYIYISNTNNNKEEHSKENKPTLKNKTNRSQGSVSKHLLKEIMRSFLIIINQLISEEFISKININWNSWSRISSNVTLTINPLNWYNLNANLKLYH